MAERAGSDTEQKIEDFAEDLGKMLGSARAKAEGWLGQRQAIVNNLTELRDTASHLLSELGQKAQRAVRRGRRAGLAAAAEVAAIKRGPRRPAGSGRKKKRTMSAATRAAISLAQKARWARQRAAQKKK
jgi:hypothetical protein